MCAASPHEQHAAAPIRRGLHRAIGERRNETDAGQRDVGAGHPAQHGLQVLETRLLCAVERAAVEVQHAEVSRRGHLDVHPVRSQAESRAQLLGIGEVDEHGVAGELRFGTDEFETRQPAHDTAPAVAADPPARRVLLLARSHHHAVFVLLNAGNLDPAPDFDAELGRSFGQHRFNRVEVGHHAAGQRVGQPVRQCVDVDHRRIEHHSGEVARCARPLFAGPGVDVRCRHQRRQHPAPVERLDRRGRQSPHAERRCPPLGTRFGLPFEHQDRTAAESELAGQEQTDRPGTHDYCVIHGKPPVFSFAEATLATAAHTARTRRSRGGTWRCHRCSREDRRMDGSARLRVTLLGAFQVTRGAEALAVPGARLRGLVARLALAGGRPVGQSVLVDAIWASDLPSDPAHALQALVSRLRRSLGSPSEVTQVGGGYRLTIDPADVDAMRFEQLATAGGAASLDEAVRLWGDRPGVEPAAVAAIDPAAATRLARLSIEAVTDLAEAELSQGRPDSAIARLTALLADQPVHERAAAVLMDALAAQGRQAEALAQYEQIRKALADDLGTDPGTALRERHLNLLRAEPVKATKPAALPAPLTSFVGRVDDLSRIDTLLDVSRLVTVLGPGGAGKTRIALEAARRREYRDGCWLIDLSSVAEPAKVAAAMLAAIGLRAAALFEASAKPVGDLDALADQLGSKETLLVVDNCEHLIDAVAHLLSALLPRCAGLRVLATSREPLAIDGEALVPLGPLPLPEPDATVEQARDTASVRLFRERAAAVRPDFTVDERNLDDVLRIVRGLDGMPLALELAAARLRTLSLADLAVSLSDRFRLLTTGSRTAFPRHRTLRAVIAWSWDLLSEDARTVAERISVLPGGVTPASAAAVCALPVEQARELLADLVDRSLLQLVPGRYRMLETIREYGLECLAEQGILPAVRSLSAEYFAELTAVNAPLLRGPRQLDALHLVTAEYDNVLAALRHLCDTSDAGLALALDLTWYWHMLGLARRILVLARPSRPLRPAGREPRHRRGRAAAGRRRPGGRGCLPPAELPGAARLRSADRRRTGRPHRNRRVPAHPADSRRPGPLAGRIGPDRPCRTSRKRRPFSRGR